MRHGTRIARCVQTSSATRRAGGYRQTLARVRVTAKNFTEVRRLEVKTASRLPVQPGDAAGLAMTCRCHQTLALATAARRLPHRPALATMSNDESRVLSWGSTPKFNKRYNTMRSIQLAMACIAGALFMAPTAAPALAGHSAKHTIAALDRDKDGSLDKGEVYRGAIANFKRLNTDKDRTLEPGELKGVLSARAFAAANRTMMDQSASVNICDLRRSCLKQPTRTQITRSRLTNSTAALARFWPASSTDRCDWRTTLKAGLNPCLQQIERCQLAARLGTPKRFSM